MSTPRDSAFNPSPRTLRQFAGLWTIFFLIVSVRAYEPRRPFLSFVIAALALTVGPMGIVWPRVIRPVFVGWMHLAYPVGWVVSRVILGTIFFGLVTPIASLLRMLRRDVLGLKRRPAARTYWLPKPVANDKSEYLRQF